MIFQSLVASKNTVRHFGFSFRPFRQHVSFSDFRIHAQSGAFLAAYSNVLILLSVRFARSVLGLGLQPLVRSSKVAKYAISK